MLGEGIADFTAGADHNVQDSRRQACFFKDLCQQQATRDGSVMSRLQDNGVPQSKRWGDRAL